MVVGMMITRSPGSIHARGRSGQAPLGEAGVEGWVALRARRDQVGEIWAVWCCPFRPGGGHDRRPRSGALAGRSARHSPVVHDHLAFYQLQPHIRRRAELHFQPYRPSQYEDATTFGNQRADGDGRPVG